MKFKPLPIFPSIELRDVPPCSTVLFYGGTKITEWFGNYVYKHPYTPPAYHAAFYIEEGLFLNVGKFKVVQDIGTEFRSNRRLDVIIYKNITNNTDRPLLMKAAYLDTSKPKVGLELPDYDIMAFLRFGFRFLRQSKKNDFCSENVVQLFATRKIKVSEKKDYKTAPWHLLEYALKNEQQCEVRTLWTGKDFNN
jgi:hypothetical protein